MAGMHALPHEITAPFIVVRIVIVIIVIGIIVIRPEAETVSPEEAVMMEVAIDENPTRNRRFWPIAIYCGCAVTTSLS